MNKKAILNRIVRGSLFVLVLSLGTLAALIAELGPHVRLNWFRRVSDSEAV